MGYAALHSVVLRMITEDFGGSDMNGSESSELYQHFLESCGEEAVASFELSESIAALGESFHKFICQKSNDSRTAKLWSQFIRSVETVVCLYLLNAQMTVVPVTITCDTVTLTAHSLVCCEADVESVFSQWPFQLR